MFADRNKIKLVNLLVVFARCVFADAKVCPSSDLYVLGNDGLFDHSTFSDHAVLHDDRILDHGTLLDHNSGTDNGIRHLSVDLRTLSDDTFCDLCVRRDILRRDTVALCVDLPVFLIQVELRNNIDELHICFPV